MNLNDLQNTPVWDWPETARDTILRSLVNRSAPLDDRLLAAELAYDVSPDHDDVVSGLTEVVGEAGAPEELRARAALAIGPALETAHQGVASDAGESLSDAAFRKAQKALKRIYDNTSESSEVRRCVFEAMVRAPEDWHKAAIREAYDREGDGWQRSAVFAMRFVPGFKDEILEALESEDEEVLFNAICAAAERDVRDAWPYIEELVGDETTAKEILIAAIDATPMLAPDAEAVNEALEHLLMNDDEEIVEAATEAMSSVGEAGEDEDWDEDEEDSRYEDEEEDEDEDDNRDVDDDDDGRRH